jgi:hypothetical protein
MPWPPNYVCNKVEQLLFVGNTQQPETRTLHATTTHIPLYKWFRQISKTALNSLTKSYNTNTELSHEVSASENKFSTAQKTAIETPGTQYPRITDIQCVYTFPHLWL